MKGAGLFCVLLRGVNFGFWSHLGCSGQTPLYLAVEISFRIAREEILKKLYIVSSFYLFDSCNQSLEWSFLGIKRRLGHT